MSKMSRQKGKTGEREVVNLAKPYFPDAHRSWQTPQPNGDIGGIPGVHLEVRRRETLAIPAWWRELEDVPTDRLKVLTFRTSRMPWLALTGLDAFLTLLKEARG